MDIIADSGLISCFYNMEDPGIERKKLHSFEHIVFITVAAVMCGSQPWNNVEDYGNSKKDRLSGFLDLSNGIPSHDTFNRFFQLLDPVDFEDCFILWMQIIVGELKRKNISIDGKGMRGSRAGHFQRLLTLSVLMPVTTILCWDRCHWYSNSHCRKDCWKRGRLCFVIQG